MALVHGAEAVVFPEPRRLTMPMFLNTARHVPVREPETSSLQVSARGRSPGPTPAANGGSPIPLEIAKNPI